MTYRLFTRWITCPRPTPEAALRLFCFPFAGGGASAFRSWGGALGSTVEVCPVQLPGREERYNEAAIGSLAGLAHAVVREMGPYLDKPYALFGHSMGALLAYEVAQTLAEQGAPSPERLLLSSYPAPHRPVTRAPIHGLPDSAFIEEMRQLDGTPEAVLREPELLAFVLPILRADFRACETYRYAERAPLGVPLTIYGGDADREVTGDELSHWRAQTLAGFRQRMFPGHHFFIQSARESLLEDVAASLQLPECPPVPQPS